MNKDFGFTHNKKSIPMSKVKRLVYGWFLMLSILFGK
jgi:hypothetical protein